MEIVSVGLTEGKRTPRNDAISGLAYMSMFALAILIGIVQNRQLTASAVIAVGIVLKIMGRK